MILTGIPHHDAGEGERTADHGAVRGYAEPFPQFTEQAFSVRSSVW